MSNSALSVFSTTAVTSPQNFARYLTSTPNSSLKYETISLFFKQVDDSSISEVFSEFKEASSRDDKQRVDSILRKSLIPFLEGIRDANTWKTMVSKVIETNAKKFQDADKVVSQAKRALKTNGDRKKSLVPLESAIEKLKDLSKGTELDLNVRLFYVIYEPTSSSVDALFKALKTADDRIKNGFKEILITLINEDSSVKEKLFSSISQMTDAQRKHYNKLDATFFGIAFGKELGNSIYDLVIDDVYKSRFELKRFARKLGIFDGKYDSNFVVLIKEIIRNKSVESFEQILTDLEFISPEARNEFRELFLEWVDVDATVIKIYRSLSFKVSDTIKAHFAKEGSSSLIDMFGKKNARTIFNSLVPEGVTVLNDGKTLMVNVWTPKAKIVQMVFSKTGEKEARSVELKRDGLANHSAFIEDVTPDSQYLFHIQYPNGKEISIADPMSKFQPDGIYGNSQIFDANAFDWGNANYETVNVKNLKISEVHVGTFSKQGTLESMINGPGREYIKKLKRDGVNAIQLMPVWEFPGEINVGYDTVFMQALAHAYGAHPSVLQEFVKMVHEEGMSVIFDIVFNHLGPEGTVFSDLAPRYSNGNTGFGDQLAFSNDNNSKASMESRENVKIQNLDLMSNVIRYLTSAFKADGFRLDLSNLIGDPSGGNSFYKDDNARALRLIYDSAREINPDAVIVLEDPRVEHEKQELFRRIWGDVISESDDISDLGVSWWSFEAQHIIATVVGAHNYYGERFISMTDLYHALIFGVRDMQGIDSHKIPPPTLYLASHDDIMNENKGVSYAQSISPAKYRMGMALPMLGRGGVLIFQGMEYGSRKPFYFLRDLEKESSPTREVDYSALGRDDLFETKAELRRAKLQQRAALMSLDPDNSYEVDEGVQRLVHDLSLLKSSSVAMQSMNADLSRSEYRSDKHGILIYTRKASSAEDADAILVMVNTSDVDYTRTTESISINEPGVWQLEINTQDENYGGQYTLSDQELVTGEGSVDIALPPKSVLVFRKIGSAPESAETSMERLKSMLGE